ncbi:Mst2 complex subunit-like protein [Emericellopsis cladophorae]|uniref:Mst2 complex subunit-like protein n=1 Tax=Emericellopsis cladophorae TaxID=2686198 RepID=A0A9Q0BFV2_9HYPO|nr:Mst2 complex subunit-like protein [Emericellopsis cladophorae]KAI6783847.1 Mst2 complex subunit-like protein [Emericellopsis cladophorae]
MGSIESPSRRTPTGRRRGRPPGTSSALRAARSDSLGAFGALAASEPPLKKRRYVPGGAGGGGRWCDTSDQDTPVPNGAATVARTRVRSTVNISTPSVLPPRERSTRTRNPVSNNKPFGFAAAVAASVHHADDYKPREERSWEEFHPNLDIEQCFKVFRSEEVDGIAQERPSTPVLGPPLESSEGGSETPSRHINPASTGNTPAASTKHDTNPFDALNGTPTRRSRRPTRDVISFYGTRPAELPVPGTPKKPQVLPIKNQTAKEKLDLKQPSYRRTNRIEIFESKTFGQARYVDKAMSNVGYQESDHFARPDRQLIKAGNAGAEEDPEQSSSPTADDGSHLSKFFRVEYDMDEQDDMWLEHYNAQRKQSQLEPVTREIFEITMTKIEKEWHGLEKRIPKPNPKPPQTHRPRSSSAAAVNGEHQAGEEPDIKCVICDDGDCENTNAIVFCDGCNLAVHQECYGVPFIPEGQWLCRKCVACGRGVPTCIFCPNTDGAFKQTAANQWSHLLCAMWIPEVSLANHTFMEPVQDVEKVPKTRWKLNCFICNQRMGACIQCSNKNCYQAFHVTCARRARFYLKMKTPTGQLAVLDGNMVLKAYCNKHGPPDYTAEQRVAEATKAAKRFYKKNMKGRIWADNYAVANVIAAQQRVNVDENQADGAFVGIAGSHGEKKKNQQPKNVWRLPSGAPVIPQAVFDTVEISLQRFSIRKRKEFLAEACRYWTLKRESRKGAALLKRLQLQMDSFSSMELTRRDFAAMGPDGKERLARRIQFAEMLIQDMERLKTLTSDTVLREQEKLSAAEVEQDFVDECYFPVTKHLLAAIDKAISLDRQLFEEGLRSVERRTRERHYTKAMVFAHDLGNVIRTGIATAHEGAGTESLNEPSPKHTLADIRERRKLGRRILKAAQPHLESALHLESTIVDGKPFKILQQELASRIEHSLNVQEEIILRSREDTQALGHAIASAEKAIEASDIAMGEGTGPTAEEVDAPGEPVEGTAESEDVQMADAADTTSQLPDGAIASETPPNSDKNEFSINTKPGAAQTGPPTPPQSNGSLGKVIDPLSDGGIPWYFKPFDPVGTTVCVDHEAAEQSDVDMQSEDLTDMDDEELKALGAEVTEGLESAIGDKGVPAAAVASRSKARRAAPAVASTRRTSARRR